MTDWFTNSCHRLKIVMDKRVTSSCTSTNMTATTLQRVQTPTAVSVSFPVNTAVNTMDTTMYTTVEAKSPSVSPSPSLSFDYSVRSNASAQSAVTVSPAESVLLTPPGHASPIRRFPSTIKPVDLSISSEVIAQWIRFTNHVIADAKRYQFFFAQFLPR